MRRLLPPQPYTRAAVYPSLLRLLAAGLFALSRGSLPLILVRMVVSTNPPITPAIVMRLFVLFTVIPAGVAWLIERSASAELELRAGVLTARRRRSMVEVPCDAIERIEPWSVPFPGPGFSFVMRSGERLRHAFQVTDPKPLLYELADRGHVEAAHAAVRHPVIVWAHAKAVVPRTFWDRAAVKFIAFAVVPGTLWFYTRQRISYGSFLGEYYASGLGEWLATLVLHWITAALYLVLYASLLRGVAESFALAAASVAPLSAIPLRRGVEVAYRVLFYGGVVAMLLVRHTA